MTALKGRGAVVTGGGRGIGRAVAEALAAEGASVVVAARTEEEIREVAEDLRDRGWESHALVCDVTDPDSVEALRADAADRLGRVDILVNNAGVAGSAPLHRISLEEWNRTLAVNATGTFLCTRAVLPGMVERGWGRVVMVASTAGLTGARYISAYAASKHAVLGLTRSVADEVAGRGVTVNAVCPGYVDTEMTRRSVARIVDRTDLSEDEARAALRARSPQGRLLDPAEVAHAVAFLCTERAGAINGEALVLDGGELRR